MRYFKVNAPSYEVRRKWRGRYEAHHAWRLPTIECSTCGQTWAGDLRVPSVDLSDLPERAAFEDVSIGPFEQYVPLAEKVRPRLPPGIEPEPGMQFGPMQGRARGRFGPLTVGMPGEVLLREDAVAQLSGEGLRGVNVVKANFQGLGEGLALYELAPPLTGKVHADCVVDGGEACKTCGYQDVRLLPHCWLDATSLPAGLDVFRLRNAETYVVVSERFVDAVQKMEASDVVFQELGVKPPKV